MTLPVIPVVPAGNIAYETSATILSASTGNDTGTPFAVGGMATVAVTLKAAAYIGVVNFKASENGTDYADIYGAKLGTATIAKSSSLAGPLTGSEVWIFQVAGLHAFNVVISGSGGGNVTVTAHASSEPNAVPIGSTIGTAVVEYAAATPAATDSTGTQPQVSLYVKKVAAGDTALALGAATKANSLPVTLATDEGVRNPFPNGATPLFASSGDHANQANAATLTGGAGDTVYCTGVDFLAFGATGASVVVATITGIIGTQQNYPIQIPAGATTQVAPLSITFNPPLKASAINTPIVATLPDCGVGNLHACTNARGYHV